MPLAPSQQSWDPLKAKQESEQEHRIVEKELEDFPTETKRLKREKRNVIRGLASWAQVLPHLGPFYWCLACSRITPPISEASYSPSASYVS